MYTLFKPDNFAFRLAIPVLTLRTPFELQSLAKGHSPSIQQSLLFGLVWPDM